jgi:hypothetical protein
MAELMHPFRKDLGILSASKPLQTNVYLQYCDMIHPIGKNVTA